MSNKDNATIGIPRNTYEMLEELAKALEDELGLSMSVPKAISYITKKEYEAYKSELKAKKRESETND